MRLGFQMVDAIESLFGRWGTEHVSESVEHLFTLGNGVDRRVVGS